MATPSAPISDSPDHAGQNGGSDPSGSILAAVSNAMVRLYKDQFGRGPTQARTDFAGPDTIVCLLHESLTPAERNLAKLGEHQRLRDVRLFFQYATEDEFRSAVEDITGRRVLSFLSAIDAVTDTSCEVFVLEPRESKPALNGA